MKVEIRRAVEAMLASDDSVSSDELNRIQGALEGNLNAKPRMGTIKEAARILVCHPRTVERYARMGLLCPRRITKRRVRYDLNEVERLATRGI